MKNAKKGIYILLYANFLIYSLFYVFAKLAGSHTLFSWPAALLYISCVITLGLYAILWQQILKRLPLSVAYANRSVTVLFGMMWGVLLFGEKVTWNMTLGAAIIMCGIALLVKSHE